MRPDFAPTPKDGLPRQYVLVDGKYYPVVVKKYGYVTVDGQVRKVRVK